MKTLLCLHALVLSLFFLLAFTTTTLAKGSYLRDVRGQPLYNGGLYYIFPAFAGNGGGLELARTGKETCPRTVVQARSDTSKGLPARLTSPARILSLTSNSLLNIEFQLPNPSTCHGHYTRLRWKVVGKSQVVKISPVDEEAEEITGPFKIQQYSGSFYKLVYCKSESRECLDLGISMDDQENRRLVVKDGKPLMIGFIKADADRSGDEDLVE